MRSITMQNLHRVVAEEKATEVLKEEITQAFGPVVNYSTRLESMIREANDRLEVLERTGRSSQISLKPSALLKFANHKSSEVRKFVARTLPASMLERYMYDASPEVRHAVARRISLAKLNEMASYYKNDDELSEIRRVRLHERKDASAVPYGERLKGKVGSHVIELSDSWYREKAQKAISDYNGNVEGMWDEVWARRYCDSLRLTSGVECDFKKLWQEIQDQLEEKDDEALVKDKLGDAAKRVFENRENPYKENVDSRLRNILSSSTSNLSRVKLASDFFSIKESLMPPAFKRMRVNEGALSSFLVPCKGRLPEGYTFTYEVENALDAFQNSWNKLQEMAGENLRIKWSPDPSSTKGFVFAWEIKR